MTTLHVISNPVELNTIKRNIKRYANSSDQLLFIGDSVTILLDSEVTEYLSQLSYQQYALKADVQCRGISQLLSQRPTGKVKQISDQEMVKLTIKHDQSISW